MRVIIKTISGGTYPVDAWKVGGSTVFYTPVERDLYLAVANLEDFIVICFDDWEAIIPCAHIECIIRNIDE